MAEEADFKVADVGISYSLYNRPPKIRNFAAGDRRRWAAGNVALEWEYSDPDNDPVDVEVRFSPAGDPTWSTALTDIGGPNHGGWTTAGASWDLGDLPEGLYQVEATASDVRGNHPNETLSFTTSPELILTVDRTPPRMEVDSSAGTVAAVTVEDKLSPVTRLELLVDGRIVHLGRPVDGVCDSPEERFEIPLPPAPTDETVSLRAVDAAGNGTEQPIQR